jgi:modification methylase
MADHHSDAEFDVYMKQVVGATLLNKLVWKNEWGNFSKKKFRQCHDTILIYCKGDEYKWYPERVQVPKVTAGMKGLNPSGRQTKLATSWIDDICLTTTSSERIKMKDGKLAKWQKPERLLNRVIRPFVDVGDKMCDPFAGVGTSGVVAKQLGLNYVGIENNPEIYELAVERISNS